MQRLLILVAVALAACQQTPAVTKAPSDDGYTRISTVQELSPLLGKRLNFVDGQYAQVNADGSLVGFFGGQALTGTWEMKDGYWCRTLLTGPERAMQTPYDCQLWESKGNKLRGTRDRGNGGSFEYTVG